MALADLCTLNQLRAFLRVPIPASEPQTPTEDDVTMLLAIAAASAAIRNACNRTFEKTLTNAESRSFTVAHKQYATLGWVYDPFRAVWSIDAPRLFVDDIADVNGLTVTNRATSESLTAQFDRGWPYNALNKDKPFVALEFKSGTSLPTTEGGIVVNAKWGWAKVPDTIVNACLLQASRFYKRRDAPFGIAGSDQQGNALRLMAKVDPDVAVMVSAFSRIWGAA